MTLLTCPRYLAAVSPEETTLLYILSTLAQTCAALAAFVGAVGIFRLQTLRDQHAALEDEARRWAQETTGQYDFFRMSMEILQERMEELEKAGTIAQSPHLNKYKETRARWKRVPDLIKDSRLALRVFEVWNVLVIVASLVGFNYVSEWADAPWLCRALWLVAVSTGLITLGSVWVWTLGVET